MSTPGRRGKTSVADNDNLKVKWRIDLVVIQKPFRHRGDAIEDVDLFTVVQHRIVRKQQFRPDLS